ETEQIQFVRNCCRHARVCRYGFLQPRDSNSESSVADPCVINVNHRLGHGHGYKRTVDIESRTYQTLFFSTERNKENSPFRLSRSLRKPVRSCGRVDMCAEGGESTGHLQHNGCP